MRTTASWTMVPLFLTTKVTLPAGAVAGDTVRVMGPAAVGVTERDLHPRRRSRPGVRGPRDLHAALDGVGPSRRRGGAGASGQQSDRADERDDHEESRRTVPGQPGPRSRPARRSTTTVPMSGSHAVSIASEARRDQGPKSTRDGTRHVGELAFDRSRRSAQRAVERVDLVAGEPDAAGAVAPGNERDCLATVSVWLRTMRPTRPARPSSGPTICRLPGSVIVSACSRASATCRSG